MITKKQLNSMAEQLDKLRRDLHTGGGAMISANYSKENNELYDAATTCKNLLTIYFGYNNLNAEQYVRLKTVMDDMKYKAIAYMQSKEYNKKNPYSIEGNPRRGVLTATGDKLTRLKAANTMTNLANQFLPEIDKSISEAQKGPAQHLSSEHKKIEEKLGDSNLSASEISSNMVHFLKKSAPKMEIMDFHRTAVNARNEYKEAVNNSFWGKQVTIGELKKDFKEIRNLHRLELMNYNNSNEFIKLYKKNRYKIRQVVDIYEWAKKCKEGTPEEQYRYNLFRVSMGLTNQAFDDLAGKVSTLEMIGRHMDARMSMHTNPEFTKMPIQELSDSFKYSKNELNSYIKSLEFNAINPQLPQEYRPSEDKIKYYKNLYTIKKLEEQGIKPILDPGIRKETSKINRVVGENFKRGFKFLNAQARVGRSQMARDMVAGDFDLPMMAKAKLGKVSLKYSTKNNLFKTGAHAGLLGARASGSVGYGFSLKNPLSSKIQVMGAAELYGARGVIKASLGNSNIKLETKADGHIGHAKAEGAFGVGHIYEKNDKGEVVTDGFGVNLKGGVGAAVFSGKVGGGFSIFGIRVAFETEGKALAAGIEGQFTFIPNKGVKLGGGGALGLGGNVYLTVEWGGLVKRFNDWKKRRAISKATLKAKKAEERQRKEAKARKRAEEKKRIQEMRKGRMSVGNTAGNKEKNVNNNNINNNNINDNNNINNNNNNNNSINNNNNNNIKRSNTTINNEKARKL